jgi:hypothetical protein
MNNNSRPLLFAVLSVVIIVFFLNFGYYKQWFDTRVVRGVSDFSEQLSYMDPQERRIIRLGTSYIISSNIAKSIQDRHMDTNALILMPPLEYMRKMKFNFTPPEPAVFYYYTGMHSIEATRKDAEKANFAIVFLNNDLQLVQLNDSNRTKVLSEFRQYKYY